VSVEIEPGKRWEYIYVVSQDTTITITLVGRKERFTYRIEQLAKTAHSAARRVSVLIGSNNDDDYRFLGGIYASGFYRSSRSPIGPDAPSCKAFEWFEKHPEHPALQVLLSRPCGRCGRTLTTPESVLRGLGPECAKRAAV